MLITTKAIVISSVKYGDADLIVTCFTQNNGLKSYLLKNILKAKKSSLKPSLFQPLMLLEIVANHREKSALHYIKEAKVASHSHSIHTDIAKTALVLFLSEVIKQCVKEEEENPTLYFFLENSVLWLEAHQYIADFHLIFLLKLSEILGFYPDVSTIENPVFNPVEGVFQRDVTNIYCVKLNQDSVFKKLFSLSYSETKPLQISKPERAKTLDLFLLYFQLHIQGFRTPKSLAVLHQIFH